MMGSLAKWVARGLLVLVALAVLALGVIYAGSERILRRRHAAPVDTALRLPPCSDDVEARRQATIIGYTMSDEHIGQIVDFLRRQPSCPARRAYAS